MFTPSRLKANEQFMKAYSADLVSKVVSAGRCELVSDIATPYVTMVVADLLGVPAEDRVLFEEQIAKGQTVGSLDNPDNPTDMATLNFIGGFMARYLQERMANPGTDLLSELATSAYPDGTTPDIVELISLSTFMFAAGQDTSAKLLCNALRYVVDIPGLQTQLREDRTLIPWMLEEIHQGHSPDRPPRHHHRRPQGSGWITGDCGDCRRQSRPAPLGRRCQRVQTQAPRHH
jgi:cytochrome P450